MDGGGDVGLPSRPRGVVLPPDSGDCALRSPTLSSRTRRHTEWLDVAASVPWGGTTACLLGGTPLGVLRRPDAPVTHGGATFSSGVLAVLPPRANAGRSRRSSPPVEPVVVPLAYRPVRKGPQAASPSAYSRSMSDESRGDELWAVWSRFEDDELESLTAAFALVACYDHDVAQVETDRFANLVREFVDDASLPAVVDAFSDLTTHMLRDFDEGRKQVLEIVAASRGNRARSQRIIRAAQAAIVADEVLDEREELALADLCEALGLDPADY